MVSSAQSSPCLDPLREESRKSCRDSTAALSMPSRRDSASASLFCRSEPPPTRQSLAYLEKVKENKMENIASENKNKHRCWMEGNLMLGGTSGGKGKCLGKRQVDRRLPQTCIFCPDTFLEINGTRSGLNSDCASLPSRRDRLDKKPLEATFVSTDSVRTGGM